MNPRIFCGTFEAEAHLRPRDLATLPFIANSESSRIVAAMDEMLFVFCGPNDRVVTAHKMEELHVEYLHSLGFAFTSNSFDLLQPEEVAPFGPRPESRSVFELMLERANHQNLAGFIQRGAVLEPFAVLPGASEVADRFGLIATLPSLEVVQRVNTKSYALDVRDRLGLENIGVVVGSVESLLDSGTKMLRQGAIIVKDDYGVSGKGSLRVESESVLRSIGQYLSSQVARGRRIRFVVERHLKKKTDFSCQFRIDTDGRVEVLSIQELENNGQAFGKSITPRKELTEVLSRGCYLKTIHDIALQLHLDGYYGDVCVDSMVLEEGKLAALVEINARKSMSLIKHSVDSHLARSRREGCLTYITGVLQGECGFHQLIALLEKEGLLYTPKALSGIIPLTSGTMFAPAAHSGARGLQGRLYICAVGTNDEQRASLAQFKAVLPKCGVRVLN